MLRTAVELSEVQVLSAASHAMRTSSGSIRVLPVVDSTVHSGFLAPLHDEDDLALLPTASLSLLADRIRRDRPDVIAIASGEISGPAWQRDDSLREMLSARPAILFTDEADGKARRLAARLRIRSVLPMELTARQLRAAIRAAAAGLIIALGRPLGEAEEFDDVKNDQVREEPLIENLTARETTVLRLMARGRGNKEIATELKISEHTAKFHVSSILAKLGAASRTEAVTIGILHGLVAI
jgi:DNA-binding NarL/FixJ family response regulator